MKEGRNEALLILEDLWNGRVTPFDRTYPKGGACAKLAHEGSEYLHEFIKELSPEGKKAFDKYYDTETQLMAISERDSFIKGVRIGAQFVLDVLGEYRSPMPQIDECV